MRLISGPAGSGKTTSVLNQFREALRANNQAVRLLVPTATLAEHLQNQFAREGFVFRRSLIQTLSRFVQPWVADMPEVSDAVLYLIVEGCLRRIARREFTRVADLPGFCAALARTIGEFSSAGCDAARLAACAPDAPLAPAFLAAYAEVDRELARRGLWLRAKRLEQAAERIEAEGTGGIRTVWLDGFHVLPDPEMRVLKALDRHADVVLTQTEQSEGSSVRARIALMRAASIEREVDEIARRILEQASAGRPFREIGIIVRPADTYVPILRSTLERFGIPVRFYFDSRLDQHAAIRFLTGVMDAMLGGWDHAQTLGALRLAPRFTNSDSMDRFDFLVREQIPNQGIGGLRALCGATEQVAEQIDGFAAIEEWRGLSLSPADWAVRLRALRDLFRPARPTDAAHHELVAVWRSQAAALDEFEMALDETAMALDPAALIGLESFWRAVKAVLRLKPLRLLDARRNVVHVLSAPEARQWVLPVVFVCGMVEKQFPQFHRADPFFPEAARGRLNSAGIRVRTAADFEREERALFDSAISRATMLVTLSYPEFDARGDRNLPSLFLDSVVVEAEDARLVRPMSRNTPGPVRRVEIRAPALLDYLRARAARVSPSHLESYLQCPFQYFAMRTMRLRPAPFRPEERLDFLTQGNIVHDVLAAWWTGDRDVEALFEEKFAAQCEKKRIPGGYHTERLRNAMLDNLSAFLRVQKRDASSRTEELFQFRLDEGTEISGKIDRLDVTPQGEARVVDYKYSATANVKSKENDPNLLQAPLYLLAAERSFGLKPVSMEYVGFKGELTIVDWKQPFPEGFLENALARTLRAVQEIRGGRVEPEPADPGRCRYCDCRDACRIDERQAAVAAERA